MLFRFWVFPDCTFLDISNLINCSHRKAKPKLQKFVEKFCGDVRPDTAAIRVERRSAQTRIEPLQLSYRINAQLLLPIVPHLERDDLAAEAVHDRRNIQLAVCALYLGNIREEFFQRAPGVEVPL